MSEQQGLIIKKDDAIKIGALLSAAPIKIQEFLQNELDRANIVTPEEFPSDVVAMNSTVIYLDIETNQENQVTLVYPHEAKIEENKISILAPMGAALIGLKVGQSLKWELPQGKEKEIKVLKVL